MKEISQVKLNVYEYKSFPFGITLYHTSIEYDDTEYSFGISNNISGVYEMAPKSANIGRYITSISLGKKTRREFFTKFEKIRRVYTKRRYNFLTLNCNHFTNDFIKFVFGVEIPEQYQSFLKLGEFFRLSFFSL